MVADMNKRFFGGCRGRKNLVLDEARILKRGQITGYFKSRYLENGLTPEYYFYTNQSPNRGLSSDGQYDPIHLTSEGSYYPSEVR